jgi:hypothetical protein
MFGKHLNLFLQELFNKHLFCETSFFPRSKFFKSFNDNDEERSGPYYRFVMPLSNFYFLGNSFKGLILNKDRFNINYLFVV